MARRGSALAAIACVGVAAAFVIQGHGWNQWAHYALIRAFDDGTTRIDRDNKLTGDKVYFQHHWYSARAPGLALASLPAYEALKTTEVARHLQSRVGDRNNSELLWLLGIWAATLPAVALMLLVRWVAEQVEPGFGTLAAVTLGLGTMVLPFSTLLFSHVLATCLGFAAFALLFREHHGVARRRPWPFALAGLLAGLAVISEYPVFIVAVVLGVYALSSGDRVRRGLAYVAGFAAGLVPLAVYNDRAFGSITHLSYAEVPRQQSGLFGIQFPRPIAAVEVLLSERGLLTLSPVLVLGAIGAVLIYRRGWRWEAGVVAAVAVGVLVYDSGYFLPFGGSSPGARFLIAMLPFLCFPLAATYRRWPGPTIALATASIVTLGIATVTRPLLDEGSDVALWARHLLNGDILPTA
ncbi:MAG: hypothetical protein QOK25_2694, partial [Thermoleophilaceae bacterium]|nr:hypothetical protein [Thermoleophilaceae bacterium]